MLFRSDAQSDAQTDAQTDVQTDTQTDDQTDNQKDKQIDNCQKDMQPTFRDDRPMANMIASHISNCFVVRNGFIMGLHQLYLLIFSDEPPYCVK